MCVFEASRKGFHRLTGLGSIKFGKSQMKDRVVPPCIRGEQRICLAISESLHMQDGKQRLTINLAEPAVGSDVANLTTTAVKAEDGKHYIVNGEKVCRSCAFASDGVFNYQGRNGSRRSPTSARQRLRAFQRNGVWSDCELLSSSLLWDEPDLSQTSLSLSGLVAKVRSFRIVSDPAKFTPRHGRHLVAFNREKHAGRYNQADGLHGRPQLGHRRLLFFRHGQICNSPLQTYITFEWVELEGRPLSTQAELPGMSKFQPPT